MEITPLRRSSAERTSSRVKTPRGLNEPVFWSSSALNKTGTPADSASVREVSSGVRCTRSPSCRAARSTSSNVGAARSLEPPGISRLHHGVFATVAALGHRQAAALGRAGTALDAVRRRDLHLDEIPLLPRRDRVDLRRAHVDPRLGKASGNVLPHLDVARRVVPGPVAGRKDARELVERQCPVWPREASLPR